MILHLKFHFTTLCALLNNITCKIIACGLLHKSQACMELYNSFGITCTAGHLTESEVGTTNNLNSMRPTFYVQVT